MELVKSVQEHEWMVASQILNEVVSWLEAQGTPLWENKQVSVEGLKNNYQLNELYFFKVSSEILGLVFMQDTDPFFWPEIDSEDTLFVHKLCLRSTIKGRGVGANALNLIKSHAKALGKTWIRLDCDDRQPLHKFYSSNGFKLVDFKKMGEYNVARYQANC